MPFANGTVSRDQARRPDESELIARIESTEPDEVMPPPKSGPPLKPEEIALIKSWVAQGADYAEHWSFMPVVRHEPPKTSDDAWATSPIDRFILARLDKAGLPPAKPADKATLIRRLSLDLTGLPPTPAEVDAFVRDDRRKRTSLASIVCWPPRLTASAGHACGSTWRATPTARATAPTRCVNIWRYRDWVIDAFNGNMPFDQFTIEQLAGDLLPDATTTSCSPRPSTATRMTNDEGGTDDEEFRVAAIKDRVDTTGQVWMGLTMGCAKCHTHKFDPITPAGVLPALRLLQPDRGQRQPERRTANRTPTPEQAAKAAELEARIAALATCPYPKAKRSTTT